MCPMALTTNFEKDGGERGGGDQKWFLELPRAKARQLKISFVASDLKYFNRLYFLSEQLFSDTF